jgi:hypothetical protein
MTGWQFPSKKEWEEAWNSAHVVYAESADPDQSGLCMALLWHARAACQRKNEQS